MAVIAECSGLLVVRHDIRTAAVAVIEVGMVGKVGLSLNCLLIGNTVFGISAVVLYFFYRKRTLAEFAVELLQLGIEFKVCITVRTFICY